MSNLKMTFDQLTQKNAKVFFEHFICKKDAIIEHLRNQSEKDGGPKASELNFGEDSLVPLWIWARRKLLEEKETDADKPYPFWHSALLISRPEHRNNTFSAGTCRIIDDLSCYWGELLIKHIPDLQWDIDPYKQSPHFCQPVVRSEFYTHSPFFLFFNKAYALSRDPYANNLSNDTMLSTLKYIKQDEIKYREFYLRNGGHNDPRVKKKIEFK